MFFRNMLLFVLIAPFIRADTGFLDRSIEVDGKTYAYQVYVPRNYSPSRTLPAILFLHGVGDWGNDGIRQTRVGLPEAVRNFPARYPAIVVMPQSPPNQPWLGQTVGIALRTLDAAEREFHVDPSREYLTGISMGGLGAYLTAMASPGRFAALVVISAGFEPPTAIDKLSPEIQELARIVKLPTLGDLTSTLRRDMPIRIFQGAKDTMVRPEQSHRVFEALQNAGFSVQYTEFPNAGHNAWDTAYADPNLAQWLFRQVRQTEKP